MQQYLWRRPIKVTIITTLLALAPACGVEDVDSGADPDDTGDVASALTGTVNPVDCGFDNGRTCKTTALIGNNVTDVVTWDPCFGGSFTWSASADFEPMYDRACIGGIATAGQGGGCSAGTEIVQGNYHSSAFGAVTLSLATDGTYPSSGFSQLTATCTNPQYLAVFRATSAGASQQHIAAYNWNTFTSTWATKSGQGMRLSKIETYIDDAGVTRFDGVYTPGSGPYGLNSGMTIAQLRAQQQTNAASGMEIADLAAQQTAGGIDYIGVWRAGTRQQQIYDGLASNFWSWSTPFTNLGYQPSQVESYFDAGGNQHYTVVMTLTPGQSGWNATNGVEYPWFAHEWRKWHQQGFRLAQIESYLVNGVRQYDGFWVPGSGSEDLLPGTRDGEFDDAFARNTAAGLELVDLDRVKLARTGSDPAHAERLSEAEYPVVAPEWMGQAESYFYDNWGVDSIGYTIALMKDGRLLGASSQGYAKAPGLFDEGVRLTADAQWDYLSVSKWITSLAAAKLAEEKHLDITTYPLIQAIAPHIGLAWQNTTNKADFWHITLHDAMTHTSNLEDGGCDNGPAIQNWDMLPGPAMQNSTGRGHFSYSGFDACFLRVWVEITSGMPFERYVDTHLFRPNGIHDLDCSKDPEKVEVLEYDGLPDYNSGHSEPTTYCAAAGFKGTPLQMLQILQMVRTPGKVLGKPMLDAMRKGTTNAGDEWTFFQSAFDVDGNGTPDAFGYSMTGGRYSMATHIAQFPSNPNNGSFTTDAYMSGIDAVFFSNDDPGSGSNIQWSSIQADPNP